MKPINRLSFLRHIDSLIAAGAGFLIIHYYTQHSGIGISPDSVTYLSAARNLHSNGSLVDFNNSPLVVFPCFYPAFLSGVISLTGQDMASLPIINGLLFALLIWLAGNMMGKFSPLSTVYRWLVLSCLVLSPCLLEVYSMAWSETIFLVLLLLFFITLRKYMQLHSLTALITLSIIAALTCITRYAGVTLLALGGLLMLTDNTLVLKRKLRNILVFVVIGCLPLIINLVRNNIVSNTLTGFREKSNISSVNILESYGRTYINWLSSWGGLDKITILIAIIIIVGFLVASWYIFRKRTFTSYENISIIFLVLYSIFIIAGANISRFEEINSRLLSPTFIPFIWGATAWIPRWKKKHTGKRKLVPVITGGLIAIVFITGQVKADYENWDGIKDAGIPGYTEDEWTQSPTVQFIQHNSQIFGKDTIYANANDAVYFYTGLPCKYLPHKESLPELFQFRLLHRKWIVWFNKGDNADLLELPYLKEHENMLLVKQFEDGAIYLIDDSEASIGSFNTFNPL